jgi:hypothetical protein
MVEIHYNLFFYPVKHLGCLQFLTIINSAAMNIVVHMFGEHVCTFLLGIYAEEQNACVSRLCLGSTSSILAFSIFSAILGFSYFVSMKY